MKYHPDKNSAPGAEEKFIEITEAYEILTGKKQAPTQKQVRKSAQTSEEEKKQRVKDAQKRYEEQLYREYLENEIYYRKLTKGPKWKMMKVSAFIGALLSLLIMADYFLPHHYVEDRVTYYSLNEAHGEWGNQLSIVETAAEDRYWISNISYTLYGRFPNIYVEEKLDLSQPGQTNYSGQSGL
jgi:curved DNA-binding protein CbpA